jgi:hypothetical protein
MRKPIFWAAFACSITLLGLVLFSTLVVLLGDRTQAVLSVLDRFNPGVLVLQPVATASLGWFFKKAGT